MNERSFRMRLGCNYHQPDNTVADLTIDHLVEGEWQALDLGIGTPGFLVFVYAVFTCQHYYLRTNCAEQGITLLSATGSIDLHTDEEWNMTRLHISFVARTQYGIPSPEATDHISGRMRQCPVSKNTRNVADSKTVVYFIQ
jgi:hypothetical protein